EASSRLRAIRNFHARLAAVDRRHLELPAERRSGHGNRRAAVQIGAIPLKKGMSRNRKKNIQISRRPAAQTGLALAREADAGSVLDARRNIDRERTLPRGPAEAAACPTRGVDHLSTAVTARTRPLQREKPLGMPNLALAAAHRTNSRFGAGLGAAARTGFAGDGCG